MALTPQGMISFFRDQAAGAEQGVAEAFASANSELVAINVREQFKCSLMQGLIGWRTGLLSPVVPMKQAVQQVCAGLETLKALDATRPTDEVPAENAAIVSLLVGAPPPRFTITELLADRLLDAVLANGLQDEWCEHTWNNGLDQLRKMRGTDLAVETYSTYHALLRSGGADAGGLVGRAARLFEKRAKDRYFSGGSQTDGGGPDNALTVDYRLAAILKKIRYADDNPHKWRWG